MSELKFAVVGSGARELVLADTIGASDGVKDVYGLPGNPGFDMLENGTSIPGVSSRDDVVAFSRQEQLDGVIIGPEAPLVTGLADALRAEGIRTVGPSEDAAQFEASKVFTQEFNEENGIPSPNAPFIAFSKQEALDFVSSTDPAHTVAKADGLAAGKGVDASLDVRERLEFIEDLYAGKYGKDAVGKGVVFQERLPITAHEVSAYTLVDQNGNMLELPVAQDHKREFDGDQGRNTGGMGAYSDVPEAIYPAEMRRKQTSNMNLFRDGLMARGLKYGGFVFSGLMLHDGEPKVLEYNVRFGDPEAQVVLPRLQRAGVDIAELMMATADGRLDRIGELPNLTEAAVTVVLAAENYPGDPVKGDEIFGLYTERGDDVRVYYAGIDESFKTAGGRILAVTGFGKNLREARDNAYNSIGEENGGIYFRGMHYRTDIAGRALGDVA